MLDIAMKFIGHGSGKTDSCKETEEVLEHLDRFLKPSHHLIQDLKLRFLKQAALKNDDVSSAEVAEKYCRDLLRISETVSPGRSKLQGELSHKYHLLEDIRPCIGRDRSSSQLVLGRAEVAAMFSADAAFQSESQIAR